VPELGIKKALLNQQPPKKLSKVFLPADWEIISRLND